MQQHLHKKSILKKTVQIAGSTLTSKFLALIRSWLEIRYFGAGPLSDAFWAAYNIPNILRKAFAEGALSAAFVPSLVKMVKQDTEHQASKLITLTLIVVEAVLCAIVLLVWCYPSSVILFFSPGFIDKPVELDAAIKLVRVLIFFVLFLSTSALLAGGMQAKNHFTVPSWGPVLLNVTYLLGLLACLYYQLPITFFSYFVVGGGLFLLLMHIIAYVKLDYAFMLPDEKTWQYFGEIMLKFLPSLLATSILEINLAIDSMFVSYLPAGQVSILKYASGFLRIPLGSFAVAFSTILLSHFSRVVIYAPKRLNFYLLEASKFILWICLPATVLMAAFSYKFFETIFISRNFTIDQAVIAGNSLSILILGLFFFSLNKTILSIYYSLHQTVLPTVITLIGAMVNTLINYLLFSYLGMYGIVFGTVVSGVVQTVLSLYWLYRLYGIRIDMRRFGLFAYRCFLQLGFLAIIFYFFYTAIVYGIDKLPSQWSRFFLGQVGYWMWTVPLSLGIFAIGYITRRFFKIKIYFLD